MAVVLDATVLIGYLDEDDPYHEAAERLIAEAFGQELSADTLTLAETMVGPGRAGRLEEVRVILQDLGVAESSFVEGSIERLAWLRSRTRLEMPGCCVLLAALAHGGAVATFDEALRRAARGEGLDVVDP
jgi:predicted nucleic acid-binding protein